MVAITKHGSTNFITVSSLQATKGFILGVDTEKLRDETERIV
jgi:hypothetical protein